MEITKLVSLYRKYPDYNNVMRDQLIEYYLSMANSLASKYVSSKHDHDDVCELAQYELVRGIERAKLALKDNNIKYFLIKIIRFRLLDYVSLDHLIWLPSGGAAASRELLTSEAHRVNGVEDVPDKQIDPQSFVTFDDVLEHCITSEEQRSVIELRVSGFTYSEIERKTGYTLKQCQRYWYEYCSMVKGEYDGEETL